MTTTADTLRRLADWCDAHGVQTLFSVTPASSVWTDTPTPAVLLANNADADRLLAGVEARRTISKTHTITRAVVDGVLVEHVVILPAPPSPAPVSPDAAEGGGL